MLLPFLFGELDMKVLFSRVLHPDELAALIRERPGVRVLDVRTPGEYKAAHIAGTYNVPLDTLGEHAGEIRASVAEPVVLICQSGQRARKAEEALAAAGMANLHVLEGGMERLGSRRSPNHARVSSTRYAEPRVCGPLPPEGGRRLSAGATDIMTGPALGVRSPSFSRWDANQRYAHPTMSNTTNVCTL